MPWTTPSLRQVREMVRNDVSLALRGAIPYGNTVLRIMSDTMAGLASLVLKYIDWLARQLMPDLAETEWLDRHGNIWLVNADGSTGRKMASLARGTVTATGTAGIIVPISSLIAGPGIEYETVEEMEIGAGPTEVAVRAITPGAIGNQPAGATLGFDDPPAGVDSQVVVVTLVGGAETERDDDLRARILERIRMPPMGGAAHDYVGWAKQIPAVTRAWCAPLEMGMGTVTVRFCEDGLRPPYGIPTPDDVAIVRNYIDIKRPVALRDFFCVAPILEPVD